MSKLRQRLQRDDGFTLIELLVVIVIIGILLAIAVPSYLGFKDRADSRAGQANVRAAVPSIEAYYSDAGNYNFNVAPNSCTTSATGAALLKACYDAGLKTTGIHSVTINSVSSGASYCVSAEGKTGEFWKKAGAGGDIVAASAGC